MAFKTLNADGLQLVAILIATLAGAALLLTPPDSELMLHSSPSNGGNGATATTLTSFPNELMLHPSISTGGSGVTAVPNELMLPSSKSNGGKGIVALGKAHRGLYTSLSATCFLVAIVVLMALLAGIDEELFVLIYSCFLLLDVAVLGGTYLAIAKANYPDMFYNQTSIISLSIFFLAASLIWLLLYFCYIRPQEEQPEALNGMNGVTMTGVTMTGVTMDIENPPPAPPQTGVTMTGVTMTGVTLTGVTMTDIENHPPAPAQTGFNPTETLPPAPQIRDTPTTHGTPTAVHGESPNSQTSGAPTAEITSAVGTETSTLTNDTPTTHNTPPAVHGESSSQTSENTTPNITPADGTEPSPTLISDSSTAEITATAVHGESSSQTSRTPTANIPPALEGEPNPEPPMVPGTPAVDDVEHLLPMGRGGVMEMHDFADHNSG